MRTLIAVIVATPAMGQGWQQLPEIPGAPRSEAVAFVHQCTAIVGTGTPDGTTATNDMWRFDLNTEAWTELPPFPGPARYGAAYPISHPTFHVFGGRSADGYLNDLWTYSALGEDWQQRTCCPLRGVLVPPCWLTRIPSGSLG